MKIHEKYIKRCIEIAKNGLGTTRPNPMVGCVIINNNRIIGEGFTSAYGGNHAEVNAIQSVSDKTLLKTSTLYVTLEPCNHHGKTPPCTQLIIQHEIPHVVIGTSDSNHIVNGKGIEALKNAGCTVTVGILETECKIHHKRFLTFHNKKRPYIILKWAETNNGFIAPESKRSKMPVWISSQISRQLVHKWRTEEHAILVGAQTVLSDNPELTARTWKGQNPIRIVLDSYGTLPKSNLIFNNEAKTLVYSAGEIDFSKNPVKQLMDLLYLEHIQSVIIEGGRKTLQAFINENLWDEARVFKSETVMFSNGIKAPEFNACPSKKTTLATDTLSYYYND